MFSLDMTNLQPSLAAWRGDWHERLARGHEGFLRFRRERLSTFHEAIEPAGRAQVDEILAQAGELRAAGFTHYVNLGIGGSSLGGEALLRALLHPWQNELPVDSGFSRYYFPDNVDPETNAGLLDILPAEQTLFHVASKSGSTAETAAQLQICLHWLEARLGREKAARHLVVSTDPEQGDLRRQVRDRGFRAVSIPPGLGGRFSVFGSVGLLPLALFGRDVEAFLGGARDVAARCEQLENNPALELAAALHAQHVLGKRNVLVLFLYSDALSWVGDWFGQLWAESLGKRGCGSTPVRAVGATDQHSQLQLYMEGPDDKTVLFLRAAGYRAHVDIPRSEPRYGSTGYLMGHSLRELLDVESLATEKALTDNGRPNASLTLDAIDERSLGGLLYFLQLVTVYAGALYGVNPFDQPGVEAGKRATYGWFGREGFAEQGDALRAWAARAKSVVRLG